MYVHIFKSLETIEEKLILNFASYTARELVEHLNPYGIFA